MVLTGFSRHALLSAYRVDGTVKVRSHRQATSPAATKSAVGRGEEGVESSLDTYVHTYIQEGLDTLYT